MALIPKLKLLSGYEMPYVGLGTYKSEPGEVKAAVKTAIELGYRHFDCAIIYGNEKEIGEAIREEINNGTVKRKDLFITTKLWNTFHSKARVMECCKKSLSSFELDYVDLYLMHWPIAFKEGDDMLPKTSDGKSDLADIDFIESWTAMQELVDLGMCRSIGVSNFNSKQLQRILDLGLKHPLTCNQIEISPYITNEKLLQFCKSKDIAVVAYSPLGSSDRPWAAPDDPKLLEEPGLLQVATKYNKSPGQIILRWGIQRGYAVIPKSVSPSRQKQNIELFDFHLTDEEMSLISSHNRNFRVCTLKHINNAYGWKALTVEFTMGCKSQNALYIIGNNKYVDTNIKDPEIMQHTALIIHSMKNFRREYLTTLRTPE